MKKIFNLILAALVIIGAAACTKSDEIVDQTQQGEGLSFYAEIVNGDTRAYIDDTDGDKTWNTIWEKDDQVSVRGAGKTYTFTYDGAKFTCTQDGVESIIGQTVTISPTVYHFADAKAGKRGWSFNTAILTFTEGMKVQLEADTSYFRYTYNGDKPITFTVEDGYTGQAGTNFVVQGSDSYSVAYNESITFDGGTGENFIAFYFGTNKYSKGAKLSYSIDGVKCKETTIDLYVGKVYNLGTLTEPVATEYGVVGSFQGWDVAAGKPVTMYEAKDGWCVARNVELYKGEEFKIVKGNTWDVSYGPSEAAVLEVGVEHDIVSENSQNIKVAKNGKFDVYLNPTTNKFKYECVEEYTGTVDIKINNKANWSPLYITLKKGENVIADKQEVTDNKIAVDMNYIAEELSYTLSNGTKTKSGIVNITKDGATITLEENVVLLKVQLTTDNAKKWWGNTMKIHVWETGTSFDTSWPGNTMKAEGNYTWSIEVPTELVGKTIKYLVHNGNGWQSSDATVTINAEGNTITGSSIGIN
ncbi:MAG: starch-binding protein [Rikenellaceae bacterium]|nr:starch-binding protein [Rikenellaceae bacterium]